MRTLRAALIAPVALLALAPAGCGDGGGGDATASEAPAGGDPAGGWPVVVEHAHGETTLEERPERIVSLNVQWTDVLLAMDVQPAGHLVDRTSGQEGPYPWQGDRLEGVEVIEMAGSLPLERILALDPDLILVSWKAEDPETYERLSGIAPTIGPLGDREVDPWQDLVEVAGQLLARPEQARQVVDDVDRLMADAAAELPGLEGRTFLMANYLPGDTIWVVADPRDGSSVFFRELGMELEPGIVERADGASGRVELSFELVDRLSSDLLVILPNGGDPHDLPGYSDLPAVADDAVAELGLADVVALNTPTPLSIPHVLDVVRPALEAAAAG